MQLVGPWIEGNLIYELALAPAAIDLRILRARDLASMAERYAARKVPVRKPKMARLVDVIPFMVPRHDANSFGLTRRHGSRDRFVLRIAGCRSPNTRAPI